MQAGSRQFDSGQLHQRHEFQKGDFGFPLNGSYRISVAIRQWGESLLIRECRGRLAPPLSRPATRTELGPDINHKDTKTPSPEQKGRSTATLVGSIATEHVTRGHRVIAARLRGGAIRWHNMHEAGLHAGLGLPHELRVQTSIDRLREGGIIRRWPSGQRRVDLKVAGSVPDGT